MEPKVAQWVVIEGGVAQDYNDMNPGTDTLVCPYCGAWG